MSEESEKRAQAFRDWKIDIEARALVYVESERVRVAGQPRCPSCFSKYPDIHGVIYGLGETAGHKCTNLWHRSGPSTPESSATLGHR